MSKKILNYHKGQNQWYKRIGGKQIYFGKSKSKNDSESYSKALSKYKDFIHEREIDNNAPKAKYKSDKTFINCYFGRIICRARKKNLEYNLTPKYCLNLLIDQGYKCALSGIHLSFNHFENTASLDRIDSTKGYIEGNVQWLHKDVNIMKWKLKQKTFLDFVSNIYNYSLKEKNDSSKTISNTCSTHTTS